jgi:probable phosphoglycerate mutase
MPSKKRKKMKTTIIAVRHGETEWNLVGKQQGHLDSALTALGLLQAKALGDGLKRFTIDRFYSGDLGRAVQTSQAISEAIELNFMVDSRLRERNLGILQGMTRREFRLNHPEESMLFEGNDPDYMLPQGESIRQRYQRAVQCVEELAALNAGRTILIVTHGGILMSLMHKSISLPLTQKRTYSLFNASINQFSISEKTAWSLDVWGDTNHLAKYGLETLDDN